jgi:hypothetical protein
MGKLLRNISLFTLLLFLVTLAVEYARKGQLQIEQPLLFIFAILGLGIFGGYMVTWVADGKQ